MLVKPFLSNGSVVALDIGVLLRLAGLDVLDLDAALGCLSLGVEFSLKVGAENSLSGVLA